MRLTLTDAFRQTPPAFAAIACKTRERCHQRCPNSRLSLFTKRVYESATSGFSVSACRRDARSPLVLVLPHLDFAERFQVGQILGTPGRTFVGDELGSADERNTDFPHLDEAAGNVRGLKVDAADARQNVDAEWFASQHDSAIRPLNSSSAH